MNLRKLLDIDLISELARRGYVVRRNAAPREIRVEGVGPEPADFKPRALAAIRERVNYDHIDFNGGLNQHDIEIHTATLRIL